MTKILYFATLMLLTSAIAIAQADSTAQLREVTAKLNSKEKDAAAILSDPNYSSLHPSTDFRDLIKANAPTGKIVITTANEPGTKIKVIGTVKNDANRPVSRALVYLYQTDSRGWYAADQPHVGGNEGDRRHARLFGYVITDANGKFELETVKPSGYPNSDLPAHIHVEIEASGSSSLISELLFDDDPRLEGDRRNRSISEGFIIAKPQAANAPFQQLFTYILKLTKD